MEIDKALVLTAAGRFPNFHRHVCVGVDLMYLFHFRARKEISSLCATTRFVIWHQLHWLKYVQTWEESREWSYRGLDVGKCFRRNEIEKKRHYIERVTTVENFHAFGLFENWLEESLKHFTPDYVKCLQRNEVYTQQTTDYIRTKLSFSLLRSTFLCLRGAFFKNWT